MGGQLIHCGMARRWQWGVPVWNTPLDSCQLLCQHDGSWVRLCWVVSEVNVLTYMRRCHLYPWATCLYSTSHAGVPWSKILKRVLVPYDSELWMHAASRNSLWISSYIGGVTSYLPSWTTANNRRTCSTACIALQSDPTQAWSTPYMAGQVGWMRVMPRIENVIRVWHHMVLHECCILTYKMARHWGCKPHPLRTCLLAAAANRFSHLSMLRTAAVHFICIWAETLR